MAEDDPVTKRGKAVSEGLSGLSSSGPGSAMQISSYKRGGKVKKTGPAKLHKGERVLTRAQARKRGQKKSKGK